MDSEAKYWLALLRMPGMGGQAMRRLREQGPLSAAFSASGASLRGWGLNERQIEGLGNPDWARVELDLDWLRQDADNHLLTLDDAAYPPLLKEIASPPPLLFVKGSPEWLSRPQIAMVGSRNPSPAGEKTALEFAAALAAAGYVITSGMALGIDAASHRGALHAGGATVAVAGTGLDRVYPAKHRDLARQIAASGALASEFPPGVAASANNFPRRNRIISGLSLGLLVVEAAQQSGSLITARMALEQGREVFAIPGSIHNPLARGCNGLIRQGAKLVETAQDIFEELGQYYQAPSKAGKEISVAGLDLEQQKLLNLIGFSPASVDSLVRDSGWPVETVSSMLLVLELQGYVAAAVGSGYYRIT